MGSSLQRHRRREPVAKVVFDVGLKRAVFRTPLEDERLQGALTGQSHGLSDRLAIGTLDHPDVRQTGHWYRLLIVNLSSKILPE